MSSTNDLASTVQVHVFDRDSLPSTWVEPLAQLYLARAAERFPDDPLPRLAQRMAEITAPAPAAYEPRYVLAAAEGRLLGFDEAGVHFEDNPQVILLDPYVLPEHRRQGIGRRLIRAAIDSLSHHPLRQAGFSLLPHDGIGRELRETVEAGWGLEPAIVGRESRLYLSALDRADIESQIEERLDRVGEDHRMLFFELDALPSPETGFDLEDFCTMVEEIENLMPLEDLELEPERYTPDRFRAWMDFLRGGGLTMWNYVAMEADSGRCLGITNVSFDPEDPRRINQWDTGVRKAAQGRGLGKALKLLMLRRILDRLPGAEFVHTENAASNAPMLAINHALGFREHHRSLGYQLPLADFQRFLEIEAS